MLSHLVLRPAPESLPGPPPWNCLNEWGHSLLIESKLLVHVLNVEPRS